jgi:hypothetical protein
MAIMSSNKGGGGQNSGEDGAMLPFLFWRVSIGRRCSPPLGAAEVSRGEPGVIPGCARGDPLTCVSPRGVAQSADVTLLPPGVYFRPH